MKIAMTTVREIPEDFFDEWFLSVFKPLLAYGMITPDEFHRRKQVLIETGTLEYTDTVTLPSGKETKAVTKYEVIKMSD